jgi:enoyl-CoA hydratase
MPHEGLVVEQGAITLVTLRSGAGNPLDGSVLGLLGEAVAGAAFDATKLLVLRAEGSDFSSGIAYRSREEALAAYLKLQTVLELIRSACFVTVSLVHGQALDGGAALALACDYRLVLDGAVFGFPTAREQALIPGAQRLAELAGSHGAFDMLLRARRLDHAEALREGLASALVDRGEADAFLRDLELQLRDVSKSSIALLREATSGMDMEAGDIRRLATSIAWSPVAGLPGPAPEQTPTEKETTR